MPFKGLLLDLDGTVYEANTAIPGAAAAIARLRAAGVPLRFVTNTTRLPRHSLLERLRSFGIPAEAEELFTTPIAAAAYLRRHGLQPIELHVPDAVAEDFGALAPDGGPPRAVVIGDLGPEWTFQRLNLAFRHILAGAELIALQKNRYWRTPDGLTLDAGPFVAALEFATDRSAILVGKPSYAFFDEAARSMHLPLSHIAMVGDDVVADVQGAQACGAAGVLVRTGKFRPEDLHHPGGLPDHVLASIAELPALIGLA